MLPQTSLVLKLRPHSILMTNERLMISRTSARRNTTQILPRRAFWNLPTGSLKLRLSLPLNYRCGCVFSDNNGRQPRFERGGTSVGWGSEKVGQESKKAKLGGVGEACVGVWLCVIWIVVCTGGGDVWMSLVQSDRYLCLSRLFSRPSRRSTNQLEEETARGTRARWWCPLLRTCSRRDFDKLNCIYLFIN